MRRCLFQVGKGGKGAALNQTLDFVLLGNPGLGPENNVRVFLLIFLRCCDHFLGFALVVEHLQTFVHDFVHLLHFVLFFLVVLFELDLIFQEFEHLVVVQEIFTLLILLGHQT